jgi:hypothetical protein
LILHVPCICRLPGYLPVRSYYILQLRHSFNHHTFALLTTKASCYSAHCHCHCESIEQNINNQLHSTSDSLPRLSPYSVRLPASQQPIFYIPGALHAVNPAYLLLRICKGCHELVHPLHCRFAAIMATSTGTQLFPSCISHCQFPNADEQVELGHRCVSHIDHVRLATSCYREKPGPGRRKTRQSQRPVAQGSTACLAAVRICSNINASFLALILLSIILISGVAAEDQLHPTLGELAERGELLFDRSPKPEPPSRHLLMERDAKISGSSDVPSATFTLVTATGNGGAGGAAAAATASVATSSPKSTSLPQPFDTTIGSNFTTGSGCPKFFNFLADPQFQQCYPFSLLLQVRI